MEKFCKLEIECVEAGVSATNAVRRKAAQHCHHLVVVVEFRSSLDLACIGF